MQIVKEVTSLRSAGLMDPGWEHGVAQDEKKKKVQCNYCGKVVSGGIYRLKQHLARLSGEVTYCDKAPEEVCLKMRENLEGCRFSKKSRPVEYEEQSYLTLNDPEEDDGFKRNNRKKSGSNNMNLTPLRSLGYVDPGWEHGVPQDERKKKVKCNYCEKIVSGGINRFKQHLARIPGEVAACKSAPEEVYVKMKENMKWHRSGRNRQHNGKEMPALYNDFDNEEDDDESVNYMSTGKTSDHGWKIGSHLRSFKSTWSPDSEPLSKRPRFPNSEMQPSGKHVKAISSRKSRKEVVSVICKFFYHAGVPAHAANSPYFQKMLELVGQYGQDFVPPSTRIISGRYLQEEMSIIKTHLSDYKASWAVTGCSILADSWQDMQDRIVINIIASCPRGMYFICSVDATDCVEDATYLYKLLDKVVDEIGEENVVQVVTQNTPSYQAAGKMLEEKRRNLFWTPCAAYCINQMLEDFSKIKWVAECLEKGQRITKFIYNRMWLLTLMKKEFTGGQELLKPFMTRCTSSFTTLQRLMDHRFGLKKMFQSNKWISSRFAKLDEGKEVEKLVFNASFWKKIQFIRKSVHPILEVLQKISGDDTLSMACIYNDMYRARIAIRTNHGDDVNKYRTFWNVLDHNWSSLLHHPLYLAAYFMNPSCRYRPDFVPHPDVVRGLNACIVRLEPDNAKRISASMQISDFCTAKADFGTDLAISTRTELNPAAWWQQHGINCLELQGIAVRILSQTCSSVGCDHNCSIFDQIYSRKHNRVSQKRLKDSIYVHYNLRLRERQMRKRSSNSVSLDSLLDESLMHDWIVETENQVLQEDEEYNEMEHAEAYENDIEYEDVHADSRRGSFEATNVADILEVSASNAITSNEDDDINFLDNLRD